MSFAAGKRDDPELVFPVPDSKPSVSGFESEKDEQRNE